MELKMTKTLRSLFVFALVSLFLYGATGLHAQEEEMRHDVPIGASPAKGPATAPVTVIEFLDFQ